jgi:hypothetical protein
MIIAAAAAVSSFALASAAWGYASSWVAEIVKQRHWPKPVNTILADLLLVGSAAMATMTASTFTARNFESALLVAAVTAVANHQLFLLPTGIGPAIQAATSFGSPPADEPVDVSDELPALLKSAQRYGERWPAVANSVADLAALTGTRPAQPAAASAVEVPVVEVDPERPPGRRIRGSST